MAKRVVLRLTALQCNALSKCSYEKRLGGPRHPGKLEQISLVAIKDPSEKSERV